MTVSLRSLRTVAMAVSTTAILAGCDTPFDFDFRDGFGQKLDTSSAAKGAIAPRPQPDNRGIISYPNYQVAVARRGDTLEDVANRIGLDAGELAEYNAIRRDDALRAGEIVALPRRVSEPSEATGGAGQIVSPSNVDITSLAGSAIDNAAPAVETETLEASAAPIPENAQVGFEPIRHTVQRGETAFTISRLYNIPVRSLAEWNGLGSDFTIRENQILLIPPAQPLAPSSSPRPQAPVAATATTAPGEGSPTPTPPSATKPLPKETVIAAADKPKAPDLSASQTKPANSAKMSYPVNGKIIRAYSKGKNNGIDISGTAGGPVVAATEGTVAAITTDADDVKIVVVRHANNIMTVYYNVDNIAVSKGTAVKRGQKIAQLPAKDSYVHFEVRKGFDSVDPMPYLK